MIFGGQSGKAKGFSPSISVFPGQYHSVNSTDSSSPEYYSYQLEQRAKSGYLLTKK